MHPIFILNWIFKVHLINITLNGNKRRINITEYFSILFFQSSFTIMFSLSESVNIYEMVCSFLSSKLSLGNVWVKSKSANFSSNYSLPKQWIYSNIITILSSKLNTLVSEFPDIGSRNLIWMVFPVSKLGSYLNFCFNYYIYIYLVSIDCFLILDWFLFN